MKLRVMLLVALFGYAASIMSSEGSSQRFHVTIKNEMGQLLKVKGGLFHDTEVVKARKGQLVKDLPKDHERYGFICEYSSGFFHLCDGVACYVDSAAPLKCQADPDRVWLSVGSGSSSGKTLSQQLSLPKRNVIVTVGPGGELTYTADE